MNHATSSGLSADAPVTNLRRDSAELRRDQLLDIAARLIESEGIDVIQHSRIAKIAGCTRSLVHHYFPKRSDIFVAISDRFYEKLDAIIPVQAQQQALRENIHGAKENSLALFTTLLELIEQDGWASLIIRATPELNNGFSSFAESIHDEHEKRWIEVLADEFNFTGVDGEIFYQMSINTANTVFLFYRKGMLNKQEAAEKIDLYLNQLLDPYRK